MSRDHEPELDAITYVSGLMRRRERRRFELHLLECETCWEEVRLDRQGRRVAEAGREVAPPELREAVRAAVADAASGNPDRAVVSLRPHRRAPALLPAVAAALSVIVLAVSAVTLRSASEPAPIRAALDTYEHSAVEGVRANMPMPDLSVVGLHPTGAEHMVLADMPVDAVAYRTDTGSRLTLFMAHVPFPRAIEAGSGATGTWHAEHEGLGMLCGSLPVAYLAVTGDPSLMDRLAEGLASGRVVIAA